MMPERRVFWLRITNWSLSGEDDHQFWEPPWKKIFQTVEQLNISKFTQVLAGAAAGAGASADQSVVSVWADQSSVTWRVKIFEIMENISGHRELNKSNLNVSMLMEDQDQNGS